MSGDSARSRALVATASQTVGPFFHFGLTPDGVVHAVQPAADVPRIDLVVCVTDGDGRPVSDAIVEIWYAADTTDRRMFARLPTDEDGRCTFRVARPEGTMPAAEGRPAPHINVCLFARGLLRQLHTRIYFAGDPLLADDPLLALVPDDRRQTLIASRDLARDDRWFFHLRLQGADETVFFNV